MVRHLIFDRLKWFSIGDNADSVNANGKNYYACPTKITLIAGAPFHDGFNAGSSYIVSDLEVDCVGVSSEFYYVSGGNIPWTNTPGGEIQQYFYTTYNAPITVPKSSCKNPKWGGKRPLSHIYQAFRAFIVRKAVNA